MGTRKGRSFVYRSGNADIRLHHEDCVRGMRRLLSPGSVDVVVTSPPYNLGIRYGRYDDTLPRPQYLDWLESWGEVLSNVLHDQGSLFLNIGGKPSDPWGPLEVVSRLRRHFVLQNTIHWVKSIAIGLEAVGGQSGIRRNVAIGHYKPINSKRFVNDCHEYIFHLTKSGDVELDRLAIGVGYQDKSNVRRWKGAKGGVRCRGNTWFVPYRTIQSRAKERPHPATFPVKIPKMCILLHGLSRVKLVMDPFLGLGHTALACKELEVPFLGFEIDEGYLEEARRRISTFDPSSFQEDSENRQLSLLFGR